MMQSNLTKIKNIILVYGGSLFGFVFVLILTRSISINDFADYAYGVALGSLLMLLVNFGSDRRLIFELVKYENSIQRLLNYNFTLRAFLFIILSIILFFLVPLFTYLVCLWYMALGLITKAVYDYEDKTIEINAYLCIERAILIFLSFLFYYEVSVIWLFGYLLVQRLAFVFFTNLKLRVSFSFSDFIFWGRKHKEEVLNSFLFVLGGIFSSFQILGSQIITKHIIGDNAVAFLNVGFQIALLVQLAQAQVIRMKSRSISESTVKVKKNTLVLLNKEIMKSLFLSIPFVIIFNVLSFLLEKYYLPEEWLGVFELLYKFSPWLLVMGAGMYISQYFINLYPPIVYLKIYSVNLVVTCLALFYFLPIFGVLIVPYLIFIIHGASMFIMYILIKTKVGK
ncbi:hypothetical protein [Pseudoalteromonas lipolytica]|uniref:Membrane protein involved in the export of O-antigen and teichoic acid n=1 Tax=Pseudoalteromonas lipolytica TaxID=570156 RepID=A0ABU8SV79_9GAMM